MNHEVRLSDETWSLLKRCAEPYVDKEPEDTIRRVLNACLSEQSETHKGGQHAKAQRTVEPATEPDPASRAPRERGAVVMLRGVRIDAVSVRDLYEKSLEILVDKHEEGLNELLPFPTSRQRYLVARKPEHPNGNQFFAPVQCGDYYMEAHKDYKNAIAHLRKLAKRMNLELQYLGA